MSVHGGAWSCGVIGAGGGLLPGGVPGPEGVFSRGGLVPGGAWWRPPGRLLLRAVRILLECILVFNSYDNSISTARLKFKNVT